MVEKFDKIVNFFTKLNYYDILKHESGHFIVGTTITILEHRIYDKMIFMPREGNISKDMAIFFLVIIGDKTTKLDKLFKKNNYPILRLKSSDIKSLQTFKESLDNFIDNNFYYP